MWHGPSCAMPTKTTARTPSLLQHCSRREILKRTGPPSCLMSALWMSWRTCHWWSLATLLCSTSGSFAKLWEWTASRRRTQRVLYALTSRLRGALQRRRSLCSQTLTSHTAPWRCSQGPESQKPGLCWVLTITFGKAGGQEVWGPPEKQRQWRLEGFVYLSESGSGEMRGVPARWGDPARGIPALLDPVQAEEHHEPGPLPHFEPGPPLPAGTPPRLAPIWEGGRGKGSRDPLPLLRLRLGCRSTLLTTSQLSRHNQRRLASQQQMRTRRTQIQRFPWSLALLHYLEARWRWLLFQDSLRSLHSQGRSLRPLPAEQLPHSFPSPWGSQEETHWKLTHFHFQTVRETVLGQRLNILIILIGQMICRIHVHIDTSPRITLSLSLS